MTVSAHQVPRAVQAKGSHLVVAAARQGLLKHPKSLPPWLFYDARGSALFEEITELSEYYLTRAERSILETQADEIVRIASDAGAAPLQVIELGAGSATKTQLLLRAVVRSQERCLYVPIDISASALSVAVERLGREEPAVSVRSFEGEHLDALPAIRATGPRRLVLFLGSSIGNYEDQDAVQLLSQVGRALLPGGCLLVGADRRKDPETLLRAYDDAKGVTARFNLNVLSRLNRELGSDFELSCFEHEARWNDAASRIEMHLVATRDMTVRVPGLPPIVFRAGESIHTESSVKYDQARIDRLFSRAGFRRIRSFTDELERFDLHLGRREER